jgi:UDP-N-acetylmuramoyl-tripeptide--D-alanyl-D-alanine ligase
LIELTLKAVAQAVDGKIISGRPDIKVYGVSTDSRTINADELFIPIRGERFDGHDFINMAFAKGATACLTEKTGIYGKAAILVKDTIKAMHALALYHRNKYEIPFVGITGSSGKTTTKDMIADVLSSRYNVLKNEANFNNFIGVPQTIFKLTETHRIGVIEMGMNSIGEIRTLTKIVQPEISVITNIGSAHIERLGSIDNILHAKLEILEGMDSNGTVVLNCDDRQLAGIIPNINYKTVTFGIKGGEIRPLFWKNDESGIRFSCVLKGKEQKFELKTPGKHNLYNTLAAITVGSLLGVEPAIIAQRIKEYSPGKMRMEKIEVQGMPVIINDAYNANPDSMSAALEAFDVMSRGKRRAAVLGDMLEMGKWGPRAHFEIGKKAAKIGIHYLLCVGELAGQVAAGALSSGMNDSNVFVVKNNAEAAQKLKLFSDECDMILFKASRGMRLEEIIKRFIEEE